MKRILHTLFFALILSRLVAQEEQCATMPMDSLLRLKFPELGTIDDFEHFVQRKVNERNVLLRSGRIADELITIPVVVHVVHNGENIGSGANLSKAQVEAQIETLNEDFRRRANTPGFNTHSRGADVEIEFALALLNPQGQTMAEPGINRVAGGRTNWSRDQIENLKTYTIWDPTLYYNIWVVDIASGGSTQLLGYAQFPVQSGLQGLSEGGAGTTDGVVVHTRAFGNSRKGNFPNLFANNNQGRTLTHETGHWLGLRHIWGDANCGNDYCDDTPPQASASSGCPTGRQSCNASNMIENYMDYSQDACMNLFTIDQKSRMRAVMVNSPRRRELVSSNVLGGNVGGIPVARFTSDRQQVLLDGQVQFSDRSLSAPTSWSWKFEGGSPATSVERNPVVSYNRAGVYAVELTVSNARGTNTTRSVGFVEVLNVGQCSGTTNFKGAQSLLREPGGGYVAGQNASRIQAISEFFENPLGYSTVSNARLKFGKVFAKAGAESEAVVNVVVWNARGFQGGPGSVLEYKSVPLREIARDVAANRTTNVTFNREVPVSGRAFHIGIELAYEGDTVALFTTRDGEVLNGTSWRQNNAGEWDLNLRTNGLNIAHHVEAVYGMKPSVQVSSSSLFINPGEAVTLQASGAGIYTWSPVTGGTVGGPMLVVRPGRTQTYRVSGSGTDVCVDTASVTIYVRNVEITSKEPVWNEFAESVQTNPNPASSVLTVSMRNTSRGKGVLRLYSLSGTAVQHVDIEKTEDSVSYPLDIRHMAAGLYLLEVIVGENRVVRRVVKY
jgi:PKD repeat protein